MIAECESFIVMYNKTVRHVKTEPLTNGRLEITIIHKKHDVLVKFNWTKRRTGINYYLFLRGIFDSWTSRDYELVTARVHNTSTN